MGQLEGPPIAEGSSAVPVKRRITRTKEGCVACRANKKGCTFERPSCARCDKLNYGCEYLPKPPRKPYRRRSEAAAPSWPEAHSSSSEFNITAKPQHALAPLQNWNLPDQPAGRLSPVHDPFDLPWNFTPPAANNDNFSLMLQSLLGGPPSPAGCDQYSPVYPLGSNLNVSLSNLMPNACSTSSTLSRRETGELLSKAYFSMVANYFFVSRHYLNHYITRSCNMFQESEMLRVVFEAVNDAVVAKSVGSSVRFASGGAGHARQRAGQLVDQALSRSDVRIEHKMRAMTDLLFFEFEENGAESYNLFFAKFEHVVLEMLAPGSIVDFGRYDAIQDYDLLSFFEIDITRSIILERRTTLSYVYASSLIPPDKFKTGLQCILGVPDRLFVLMAEVSNLAARLDDVPFSRDRDTLPAPFQVEAAIVASAVASFQPSLLSVDPSNERNVAEIALQRIWWNAMWIHYHQRVFFRGALHKDVAEALAQILELVKAVEVALPSSLRGPLALPLFLAASVAVNAADRERCRGLLVGLGNQQVLQDNLALIEEVWAQSDSKGIPANWHDLVRAGRGHCAFL